MTKLPFRVECKSFAAFFEVIAAFNTQSAAIAYAGECALANMKFSYRVKHGKKTVQEFGPEQ